MKSIKTILLGTTLAAGLGLFLGTDANAESLYTVKQEILYQQFLINLQETIA